MHEFPKYNVEQKYIQNTYKRIHNELFHLHKCLKEEKQIYSVRSKDNGYLGEEKV